MPRQIKGVVHYISKLLQHLVCSYVHMFICKGNAKSSDFDGKRPVTADAMCGKCE